MTGATILESPGWEAWLWQWRKDQVWKSSEGRSQQGLRDGWGVRDIQKRKQEGIRNKLSLLDCCAPAPEATLEFDPSILWFVLSSHEVKTRSKALQHPDPVALGESDTKWYSLWIPRWSDTWGLSLGLRPCWGKAISQRLKWCEDTHVSFLWF